jgi:hypothetical protein
MKAIITIHENKSVDIKGNILGDVYGASVNYNGIDVFIPVSYPTREGAEKRAIKISSLLAKGKYKSGLPLF